MNASMVLRTTGFKLQLSRIIGSLALTCILMPGPLAAAPRPSISNDCDRLTGSRYDSERNRSFDPVDISEIDVDAATKACSAALQRTNAPRSAFQLGRTEDRAGNVTRAVALYSQAAKAGYAIALVHLGVIAGRMGDAELEFRYFNQAAEKGNALGAYNLGVAYRDGSATPVNADLAIRWFTRASLQGYDLAAYNLGVIYDEGQLVPEDNRKAIDWYNIAAARGNVDAMINLGLMLETGEGTARNITAAAVMYRAAAVRGDEFGVAKFNEMRRTLVAHQLPPRERQTDVAHDFNVRGSDLGSAPAIRRKAI